MSRLTLATGLATVACCALALTACTSSTPTPQPSTPQSTDQSTPATPTTTPPPAAGADPAEALYDDLKARDPNNPAPLPSSLAGVDNWKKAHIVCPYTPLDTLPEEYAAALESAGINTEVSDATNWLAVTDGQTTKVLELPVRRINLCTDSGSVEIASTTVVLVGPGAEPDSLDLTPVS